MAIDVHNYTVCTWVNSLILSNVQDSVYGKYRNGKKFGIFHKMICSVS